MESIISGANKQFYNFNLLDTATKLYWVMVQSKENKACFTKSYFGEKCNSLSLSGNIKLRGSFNVQPNPFNDRMSIIFNESIKGQFEISLLDMLGKEIFHKNSVIPSQGEIELDLSSISYGVYMLNVKAGDELFKSIKIIKE